MEIRPDSSNNCLNFTLRDKRSEAKITLTANQINELRKYLSQKAINRLIILSDYEEDITEYVYVMDVFKNK
jgi:hypothetical protein